MRRILSLAGLSLALAASTTARAQESQDEAIRGSVVKIYSTMRSPDVIRPWQKSSPQEATGTGVGRGAADVAQADAGRAHHQQRQQQQR